MDKTDKRALMLAVVDALTAAGPWCGETYIQEACFILQTILKLPTDFKFILYKQVPYSFDLQEDIGELIDDNLLASVPSDIPNRLNLAVTEQGKQIESLRAALIEKYSDQIRLVSVRLGQRRISDLEKIATAIYVTQELEAKATLADKAKRITYYKKHVSLTDAEQAVRDAEAILAMTYFGQNPRQTA